MNIELTPYGRYLLSIGKLKPKYYEFVDDDILYDNTAAGATYQVQEEVHNRIVNETPRLKSIYLKKGVESDTTEEYNSTASMNIDISIVREEFESVSHNQKGVYAMGRSSYSSDKLPNFQVSMLRGEIQSSTPYLKTQPYPTIPAEIVDTLHIPQVDVTLNITATTGSQYVDPQENHTYVSKIFEGGDYVKLDFEEPIIHLKEFGSFYEKENFEIEVFDQQTHSLKNGGQITNLIPLKFVRPWNAIENDILVDDVDLNNTRPAANDPFEEADSTLDMVSYFFNLLIDNEIPREELCEAVDNLEINSQFLDEELICPDKRTDRFNIYATRVQPGDLEDCD